MALVLAEAATATGTAMFPVDLTTTTITDQPLRPSPAQAAFYASMMNNFANHPFTQNIRQYFENLRSHGQAARGSFWGGNNQYDFSDNNTFVPPVDIFNTPNNWTIHIALPGASKEDIGVSWAVTSRA